MPSFQCSKCSKIFTRNYNLQRHYERKTPCILATNTQFKHEIELLNSKTSIKIEENVCMIPNDTKIIPNNPKIIPNNPKIIPTVYKCKFCFEIFKTSNSLYKHKNELRCKEMPKREVLKIKKFKKNKIIKKKLESENSIVVVNNSNNSNNNSNNNNTINNNNTNTINNNINNINVNINPFGKENTDFLTRKDIIKILNKCYMGVPTLIKKIHNRPENRNLYLPNMNKNIMAYLNKEQELEYNDYNEICEELINKNIDRIDEYFIEFEKELKENVKKRMIKVLSSSNNGTLDEKYMSDIKYYLMNISRKNKKELNDFIDKLELKLKK